LSRGTRYDLSILLGFFDNLGIFVSIYRTNKAERPEKAEKARKTPFTSLLSLFSPLHPFLFVISVLSALSVFSDLSQKKSPVHNEVNRGKVAGKGRVD
jgi:hypothetical protein